MITNLIYFLYNIKIEYIRKSKGNYIFFYNNNFYIFKECFITEDYFNNIYSYINSNIYFHEVIKNRNNKYISKYNNRLYILMRTKINGNRLLLLEDIYNSKTIYITYVKKERFSWISLWKSKIDQIEYVINNNRFNISTLSIVNYFLGISEIAINIINENIGDEDFIPLSICHRRVSNDFDLYQYYDVTDLIIDHFTRDIGEYIKSDIYNNKFDLSKYKIINNLNKIDKILLLSRIMFPSYFFDIFDSFILENKNFLDFDKYFIDIERYENNIKELIDFMTK